MRKLVFGLSAFCLAALLAVAQPPGGDKGKRPKDSPPQKDAPPKDARPKDAPPKKDARPTDGPGKDGKGKDGKGKDGKGKDGKGGQGGLGGFGPGGQPGQVLAPFFQQMLNLSPEQRTKVAELQKEVDGKLSAILTEEQQAQFKGLRDRGFGGPPGFPGGPGFPPGPGFPGKGPKDGPGKGPKDGPSKGPGQ